MQDVGEMLERAMHCFRSGLPEMAARICQQALEADSANADALQLLAVASVQLGKPAEAVDALRRAIAIAPDAPQLHNNLGEALRATGDDAAAESAYRRALHLAPDYPMAMNNLAMLLLETRRIDEATALLQRTVEVAPDFPKAHYNLANAYLHMKRTDEAIAEYGRVIELAPDDVAAHVGMASALADRGRLEETINACWRALRIDPEHGGAHDELALALHHMGRSEEAIAHARNAIDAARDPLSVHSGLLLYLNYTHGDDGPRMLREHRAWAERHADKLAPAQPSTLRKDLSSGKIRIGYVSPDLRNHAVARLAEPLLKWRDRQRFDITCYSDNPRDDEVTARLKGYADRWRDTSGVPDVPVAELIRADQIDILVDMAGHTGLRMLLFARKPAPVQVTHFGYPNTTGLRTMDWRITDPVADPPGMTEAFHSERLMRLDGCAWCYEADDDGPDPGPLPADDAGFITFGSFNNAVKVTAAMIAVWAELLRQAPKSKMVLLTGSPNYDNRERIAGEFARHGIAKDRLTLLPRMPRAQYLAEHRRVDIALDAFPYNGGVTTLDSLWMGLPVVTLAGTTHVSRVGASMVSHAGLGDLVAKAQAEYVSIAAKLADDLPRLRTLRAELRGQMMSTIGDGQAYARRMERAFQAMIDQGVAAG